MGDFVEIRDFNGLGERVNLLSERHAACEAKTCQRLDNVDMRLNAQNTDIQKIFEKIDEVKGTMNKGLGGLAVLVFLLQAVAIFVTTVFAK